MSMQKKSLIGNLTAAKKAIVAALNVASTSDAKFASSKISAPNKVTGPNRITGPSVLR